MTTAYSRGGVAVVEEQAGSLTYGGRTWRVEAEPVVVEEDGDSVLVEVWITRGEGIGESSES
jgi:membrane protein implicated in regulation of membrane protease activity